MATELNIHLFYQSKGDVARMRSIEACSLGVFCSLQLQRFGRLRGGDDRRFENQQYELTRANQSADLDANEVWYKRD
jgi:hypothetical protein